MFVFLKNSSQKREDKILDCFPELQVNFTSWCRNLDREGETLVTGFDGEGRGERERGRERGGGIWWRNTVGVQSASGRLFLSFYFLILITFFFPRFFGSFFIHLFIIFMVFFFFSYFLFLLELIV